MLTKKVSQMILVDNKYETSKTSKYLLNDYTFNWDLFKIENIFSNGIPSNESEQFLTTSKYIQEIAKDIHSYLLYLNNMENFQAVHELKLKILPQETKFPLFNRLINLWQSKNYYLCFLEGISFFERALGDFLVIQNGDVTSRELRINVS